MFRVEGGQVTNTRLDLLAWVAAEVGGQAGEAPNDVIAVEFWSELAAINETVGVTGFEPAARRPEQRPAALATCNRAVQARYSHVTPEMRRRMLDGLTQLWTASLDRRRAMNSGSPVSTLDALLRRTGCK